VTDSTRLEEQPERRNITWRVPDCAYCEKSIGANSTDFVQAFSDEGDYYFHPECYAEWQEEQGKADAWAGEGRG
jgi:hypothetical protein